MRLPVKESQTWRQNLIDLLFDLQEAELHALTSAIRDSPSREQALLQVGSARQRIILFVERLLDNP